MGNEKVISIKLLILTTSFPRWISDTTPSFVYDFAKRLLDKGFEIVVLAPHSKGAKKFEIMEKMKVYRFPYFYPYNLQKVAYGGGIPYNIKNFLIAKIQLPLFFLFELIYALKVVKIERVETINSHWFMPQGLVGAICKQICNIPHIATIHSSEVTLVKKMPFGDKISNFVLENSNHIISVSKHRISELKFFASPNDPERYSNYIDIIPMGIDTSAFCTSNKNELKNKYKINSTYIVLFVGILTEVKGCKYLIKAFEDIVKEVSDITLLIVGNGPLEYDLKKKVSDLYLDKYIRFEGFVENSQINDYYSMADIVVIPSIIDSSGFEEGLPVVLLEALAGGKPIISTKINGVMEVIKDGYNGILLEPKNSSQISSAVLELINNKELKDKLSINALETGKKYDWNIIAAQYIRIFEESRPL